MKDSPWLERREAWKGPVDFSKCHAIRSAIHLRTGGLTLETKDYGGYIRTNPFIVKLRRVDSDALIARINDVFFGADYSTEEVITARMEVLDLINADLQEGKPNIKRIRSAVQKRLGSDWIKSHATESKMGSLGEVISSAGWRNLLCWLTPEADGPTKHYANHRSCWWGMQNAGESGRRKCFQRCRFKAAGGIFLIGKFTNSDNPEETPIGIEDDTDLRACIIAMNDHGFPVGPDVADITGKPLALFNTYDRLSTSGWETDRSTGRNRWLAEHLAMELSLVYNDSQTYRQDGGADRADQSEFETNSGHACVLSNRGQNWLRLKPHAQHKNLCGCRRDYIAAFGSRSECDAEGVRQLPDNPRRRSDGEEMFDHEDRDEEEDDGDGV